MSGDFNTNGIVDAADYLIWRKSDGAQEGYESWRANFGKSASTSDLMLATSQTVPEPTSSMILGTALTVLYIRRRATLAKH
jgi:hypothetical protein